MRLLSRSRRAALVAAMLVAVPALARASEVSSGTCSATPTDATGELVASLESVTPATDCSTVPKPQIPGWYPAAFDLAAATTGAKGILTGQGHDLAAPGTRHVVFSDIDQTILKTVQPVLLRNAAGGLLHEPDGTLIMIPDKDFVGALNKLKAKYPTLDWASYSPDFSEFNSVDGILNTPSIATTVAALKKAKQDPATRVVLITARSGDNTADAMHEYSRRHGFPIDGVMAVNNKAQNIALGMTDPALKSAMKKAISMAANLKLMDPDGTKIQDVTYYEDGDDNMADAMQLLPAMFPAIKFRFVDLIHTGHRHFVQKEVSKTGSCGALTSSVDGHTLTPDEIAGYKSVDIEWPPKPEDGDLPAPQS